MRWQLASRIVPTRYPAVTLFDRVADAADFDALYALEAMTNERSRDAIGEVERVPVSYTHLDVYKRQRAGRSSTGWPG